MERELERELKRELSLGGLCSSRGAFIPVCSIMEVAKLVWSSKEMLPETIGPLLVNVACHATVIWEYKIRRCRRKAACRWTLDLCDCYKRKICEVPNELHQFNVDSSVAL